jgi:hypothetical protein
MNKKRAFILASSIVCTCITAAEVKKPYRYWVQQADTIYIYSAQGTRVTEIPITQNPSLDTIKKCLKEVLRTKAPYAFYPIRKSTWVYWSYLQKEISQGKIKDYMDQYDTDSFWIREKRRKPHQS